MEIIEKQTCMRSVAECTSYCYSQSLCNTAVYMRDTGDCYLVTNYTTSLQIVHSSLSTSRGVTVEVFGDGSDFTHGQPVSDFVF